MTQHLRCFLVKSGTLFIYSFAVPFLQVLCTCFYSPEMLHNIFGTTSVGFYKHLLLYKVEPRHWLYCSHVSSGEIALLLWLQPDVSDYLRAVFIVLSLRAWQELIRSLIRSDFNQATFQYWRHGPVWLKTNSITQMLLLHVLQIVWTCAEDKSDVLTKFDFQHSRISNLSWVYNSKENFHS